MFRLSKWYLDLVTEDGAVLIGYRTRLQWGLARVRWASVLCSPPDGPPEEQVTLRDPGALHREGDMFSWRSSALGIAGRWRRLAPPIGQVLWRSPRGTIRWNCLQPAAAVTVRWRGIPLEGTGYLERLTLTLRPWRLPFTTLRWGRYASKRHAITWIAWTGSTRRCWIWRDGRIEPDAQLDTDGVANLADGLSLRLGATRDIQRRDVVDALVPHVPGLRRRLRRRLPALQEHKRVSPAVLLRDGETVDHSWTIHEEVNW